MIFMMLIQRLALEIPVLQHIIIMIQENVDAHLPVLLLHQHVRTEHRMDSVISQRSQNIAIMER